MKKHELLAPAGSLEICKAVIAAGADAVYLGGEKYGARAFAQNFSRGEVLEALDFAHLYGRKIFLTVNTLLKNKEQGGALFSYIRPYYERGLDAVIVQDYGVFQFLKRNFPDLPLHVSTQTSVSNVYGAKFFLDRGAARIVPSRELSLREIRQIYEETGAELECFIHGALCYSYSGQCLLSSLLGGRSGNRGRCAQPCRLAYEVIDENGKVCHKKEKYPLSPRDLNTLEILPKLCEAGIYSFKIEGRMKSLEYAAGVTDVYRRYLDLYECAPEEYAVAKEDLQSLLELGNRNGFTKGYYEMRSGRAMMTLTESSHASAGAKAVYRPAQLDKIPVSGEVQMRVGEPMRLTLWLCPADHAFARRQARAVVDGAPVFAAQNRPLAADDVRARFSKTGDTQFEMQDLKIVLDGDCFVPVGQMNELRRRGLALLREKLLAPHWRDATRLPAVPAGGVRVTDADRPDITEFPEDTANENSHFIKAGGFPKMDVWVSTPEQLDAALAFPFVDMVTLDFADAMTSTACETGVPSKGNEKIAEIFAGLLECSREKIRLAGKRAAFALPHVFRENSSAVYRQKKCREVLARFDLIWARTYDELDFFLPSEKLALDDHLYVCSGESAAAFRALGVNRYTASPELNRKELRYMPNARAELPVYGYAPMMISAQCVYKNYVGCRTAGNLFLRDRYFKKFFVSKNCADCYNIIYNSQPLYLLHQADEVQKLGFGAYRISFTRENADDVRRILEDYRRAFPDGERIYPPEDFTTGHFRRGVE